MQQPRREPSHIGADCANKFRERLGMLLLILAIATYSALTVGIVSYMASTMLLAFVSQPAN
jgi:hypothetical protein